MRWAPVVVAFGVVVTLSLVTVLADAAWRQVDLLGLQSASTIIGAVLGGVGAVALLSTWWTARVRDVSWTARIAVSLVCVHIAIAAGAWLLSSILQAHAYELPGYDLPLQARIPAPYIALGAGALVFVAAWIHSRVRRLTGAPGWLRGTVVFALALLLFLGLWIPVAVRNPAWSYADGWRVPIDFHVTSALVPPAVAALVVAVVAIAWPRLFHAFRWPASALVGAVLLAALAVRSDAPAQALVVYNNYVHVLFSAACFALAAIAALAYTHARALRANRRDIARAAPWVQRGRVEVPAGAQYVGAWHVDGWLLGLRTSLRGFTLRTDRGEALVVPDGARLVAPVPEPAGDAPSGELIPTLQIGDPVIVSGFVAPAGDGPYRTGGLPIPGTDGLVVTVPRRADESIARDVLLLLYRPCVLFLIVSALAALPGIAGKETTSYDRYDDVYAY